MRRRFVRRIATSLRSATGVSAIEVVLALVVMSTAILGTAAAQTGAWRVMAGARQDTEGWAALQAQAEQLIARGHDRVTPGTATIGDQQMAWTVAGTSPKVVTLTARRRNLTYDVVDTLRIVLRASP